MSVPPEAPTKRFELTLGVVAFILNIGVLGGTVIYNGGILKGEITAVKDQVADLKIDIRELRKEIYTRPQKEAFNYVQ